MRFSAACEARFIQLALLARSKASISLLFPAQDFETLLFTWVGRTAHEDTTEVVPFQNSQRD
jgi:hypothetical protein